MAHVMFRMLDHYHEVVGSVEGAELELLLEDLKATEVWDEIFPKQVSQTNLVRWLFSLAS